MSGIFKFTEALLGMRAGEIWICKLPNIDGNPIEYFFSIQNDTLMYSRHPDWGWAFEDDKLSELSNNSWRKYNQPPAVTYNFTTMMQHTLHGRGFYRLAWLDGITTKCEHIYMSSDDVLLYSDGEYYVPSKADIEAEDWVEVE